MHLHTTQHLAGDRTLHHDARHHRSGRATPWFVVAAVAFLAALVAGCGGGSSAGVADSTGVDVVPAAATDIFDSDFLPACDGVPVEQSTPFSQTPGAIHPVVVLAGEGTEMYGRSTAVREAWSRTWTADDTRALAEIELVLCAERTSSTPVEDCTGYEVDGVATDHVVHLHEVVYDVTLREAFSGDEVAHTTITARDAECPMFVSFSDGEDEVDHFSFDDAAVQAFLEPYVTP